MHSRFSNSLVFLTYFVVKLSCLLFFTFYYNRCLVSIDFFSMCLLFYSLILLDKNSDYITNFILHHVLRIENTLEIFKHHKLNIKIIENMLWVGERGFTKTRHFCPFESCQNLFSI